MSYGPEDPFEKTSGVHVNPLRARPNEPLWQLHLQEGPGAPRAFPLLDEEILVGRAADATIAIDSDDLSRKHARFKRDGDTWTVEDLESRNGVFLNGVKVHFATLRHGDVIQLATVLLQLRELRE